QEGCYRLLNEGCGTGWQSNLCTTRGISAGDKMTLSNTGVRGVVDTCIVECSGRIHTLQCPSTYSGLITDTGSANWNRCPVTVTKLQCVTP
ncbi:MAG: hypothetical protein IJ266_05915, partial [Elusimicrobiaceae bacterium]|nr:hypothetical protein [Elusimicrobiaceae bacterium]